MNWPCCFVCAGRQRITVGHMVEQNYTPQSEKAKKGGKIEETGVPLPAVGEASSDLKTSVHRI